MPKVTSAPQTYADSPERREIVVEVLKNIRESGLSIAQATLAAGISHETWEDWSRDDNSLPRRARAERAVFLRDRVQDLLERNPETGLLAHPREVAWMISKTHNQEYGDKVIVEQQGTILHISVNAQELELIQQQRAKAIGGRVVEGGVKQLPDQP